MRLRLLSILLVLSAGVIFGFSYNQNAYAVTGTISDGASCVAILPGATWDGVNNQCVSNGVTVNTGETLTIANGISLNVQAPGITNQGTIINNGKMYYVGFSNHGNYINHGPSAGQGWENFINYAGGSISNDGTITFTGSEYFANYGTIDNLPAGIIYQGYGQRDIWNYNMFQNDGTIYLGYSNFWNKPGGQLVNNGKTYEGGEFNAFYNDGGTLVNTPTGNFTTLQGYAYFRSGDVTNNGFMSTTNQNSGFNEGFWITGGTFTNNANGLIVNSLFIENDLGASLTNNGVIRNDCYSTYVGNEPTPNPTVHIACPAVTISAPTSGSVGNPVQLTANVVGGLAPFTYNWVWLGYPSGSNVAFSNPHSATTSFTPDLPGNYWLQVGVADSEFVKRGNAAQITIPVTIAPVDRTPPVVTVPAPITVRATDPSGAVVTFTTSATDPDDTAGSVVCNPPSGSTFPIGITTVKCTSTDTHNNVGSASFTVTVQTPPTVSVTTPTNGATFTSNTVIITGTASSSYTTISNVQVSIDGSAYSPTVTNTGTAFSTWSYTATGLANGAHSVTAKATDNQGLIGYSTNVVASTPILTGNGGQEVVFDSNNGNIYVANYDPTFNVAVVSGSTNQVLTTIPDARGPTGIAFDPLNHYIYAADYNAGTVTVINDNTNSIVGSPISVGAAPFGVIYVPNGDIYVANTGSSSVSVISPSSNTVVSTITGLGNHPQDFTYDSTHHLLYMTNQGSHEVTVIDPTTNSIVGSPISVGNSPRGLVYDPANGDIYVANNADSSVSIINTTSNTVVSTLTGGFNSPTGVSLDPANGLVYVANFNGNTLSVIDTTTNTIINPVNLPGSTYYYYEIFDPVNSDIYATSNGNLARVQTQTQFIVNSQVSTTTTLASSQNPSTFDQSISFTAIVTPQSGSGTPSGSVQFQIDSSNFGSPVSLAGGSATSGSTNSLSVGPHTITATYSSDSSFTGSSGSLTQTVNKAPTSVNLISTVNPSTFGQSTTFTATINNTGTGGITFKDGYSTLSTIPLTGNSASYSTSSLSVGPHNITAIYSGDASFTGATSNTVTQTVNKITTTTTLSPSSNSVNSGQSVILTTTVNPTVPDGETITFNDGTTLIGTGTTSAGIATLTSTLSVGTHSITAAYPGDATYLSSTSTPVTITVLSLLQEKQSVIPSLQSLTPVNNEDKKHIKNAIEAVQDSVDSSLWQADGMHLNVKKGEKVFDDEKQAVDQLKEIIEDKDSTSLVATVQDAINTLVDVDQKLAQNAVSDANVAANAYTGKSKDVKQDVIEAQNEIAKATSEFNKGQFASAIEHYDNTWSHAQDAIVDTTQNDNDDHDEDGNHDKGQDK